LSDELRLNHWLALAGVASRRAADRLIAEGRVTVNGHLCHEPGLRVAPGAHVKVDGKRVQVRPRITLLMYKPRGFVCTKSDELGRQTIYALLPRAFRHLNHVGRLDRDSEGLLVLTNDGELARRLTHPSQAVEKDYLVTVNQALDEAVLARMVEGVHTRFGKLRAKAARRVSPRRARVILDHGVKRQLRLMFEALGFEVTKLVRTRIGSLGHPLPPPGAWRQLAATEVAALLRNPQILRKNSRGPRQREL
jgi:23S rRNA pseudouridine2605 synthase